MSDYIDRQDLVSFWLAYSFPFGAEPLPSMFRRKTSAVSVETPAIVDRSNGAKTTATAAGLLMLRIPDMKVSHILACVLFVLAALDGVLLTMASYSADRAAVTASKDAIQTATLSSPATIELVAPSQFPAIELAENRSLPQRLDDGLNIGEANPSGVAVACAVPSLDCWKTATVIR